MSYTSIQKLEGIDQPADYGTGIQYAYGLAEHHPGTVLQIGLWMVGALPAINEGALDEQIDQLAALLARLPCPVFLRIGYEFDMPENGYEPQAYIAAFRRIADRFRAKQVGNVAFVWHSWTNDADRPTLDWYPGNNYVDWFGVSYFNADQLPHAEAMARLAKEYGKPLMIAEASPVGFGTRFGEVSWRQWFQPMFDFIERHDVKALCYVNWNWDAIPMFSDRGWGDGRIQADEAVKSHWLDTVSQPRYLHGD